MEIDNTIKIDNATDKDNTIEAIVTYITFVIDNTNEPNQYILVWLLMNNESVHMTHNQ